MWIGKYRGIYTQRSYCNWQRNDGTRKKWLQMRKLTLAAAVDICRDSDWRMPQIWEPKDQIAPPGVTSNKIIDNANKHQTEEAANANTVVDNTVFNKNNVLHMVRAAIRVERWIISLLCVKVGRLWFFPIVPIPIVPDSHIPDTRSQCRLSKITENVCYHDELVLLVTLLACVCTRQIKLY